MNVLTLPAAELEAGDTVIWYESQRGGLGGEFKAELDRAIARIASQPETCGPLEYYRGALDIRRCILHRFPYLVVFQLRSDSVLIVAVSHKRRRPAYWLDRIY